MHREDNKLGEQLVTVRIWLSYRILRIDCNENAQNDNPMVAGEYIIDGPKITFHSESMIDGMTGGCPAKGWYNWEYKNKALSFEKDTDLCATRIEETDDKSFVLIEE